MKVKKKDILITHFLEKAIELFMVDSKKTEKKDIDKMCNSLNKFGRSKNIFDWDENI